MPNVNDIDARMCESFDSKYSKNHKVEMRKNSL